MSEEIAKGFDCSACKKSHEFPAYVFAHWDTRLTHTCDCGARHVILRGKAKRMEEK